MKRKVWILSDGAPGHLSQSRGVVDALATRLDLEVDTIPLKVRSPFWKRLGRLCLPRIRATRAWLARIYDIAPPPGRPDLIVSSGANTLLANALLARQHRAANVYSGTLKGYDPDSFDCVFTVVRLAGVACNLVLPLPPVPGELARPLPAPSTGTPRIAVLIGGDGAGYVFRDADWHALADGLAGLARREGAQLLLTTSRRTGAAAEAILRGALPPALLADAVWWEQAPRKVVRDFLATASAVVVTEDSLTMVAESIYSGRPVLSVSPATAAPNANDGAALEAYAERGLLARCPIAGLPSAALPPANPSLPDVQAEIAAALLPLLEHPTP
ncbi:ELM1/GtrOC1 family putative glycosyltransferase [Thauera sp. WH-1]|uniref:ELM1/GtrOC1 family putative glycosyltransferase n=1 Tax=Thauera sp. WH-1 TaxID=3398230 RepID=UPI0039FD5E76